MATPSTGRPRGRPRKPPEARTRAGSVYLSADVIEGLTALARERGYLRGGVPSLSQAAAWLLFQHAGSRADA